MKQLLQTHDTVLLERAHRLLNDHGIMTWEQDAHPAYFQSGRDLSLKRVMVNESDHEAARKLLVQIVGGGA